MNTADKGESGPRNEDIHSARGRTGPHAAGPRNSVPVRVDCRDRAAREVLLEILPRCLEARAAGTQALVRVENLELLSDSVTRLLKALDRLAEELGAEIALADSSGFAGAFVGALSERAHVDAAGGR